jgi:formimidoylglutamase
MQDAGRLNAGENSFHDGVTTLARVGPVVANRRYPVAGSRKGAKLAAVRSSEQARSEERASQERGVRSEERGTLAGGPDDAAPDPLEGLRAAPDPRDPRASALLWPAKPADDPAGRRVLLGLPYDGGIPSRPGARFGPRALRQALAAFGSFDGETELAEAGSLLDLGDLALPSMNALEAHRRIEEAARRLFALGARPLFVGGDHGITGSLIRGLAAAHPDLRLALVSVDAHLDVREYDGPASLSSGTPFRRALETGILAGERVAMIGLRRFANSRHYLDWARHQGIRLATVEEVERRGAAEVAEEALRVAEGADALYLSIDLDAADAGVAPGVSAAGVGGLLAREMITLVRTLAAHPRLLAADLMELSPPHDPDGRTAKLAARLLLEVLAAAPAAGR